LALIGTIGSGKTRLARGIGELYGIPCGAIKVDERKEGDFWPALDQGGVTIFDNVDTHVRWFADALATAATGGCSQARRLYTNSQTVTLRANAWVVITSSNATFASDPGLADRMLVVRMGRRTGETADEALSREIEANRDAGLSFVAHTLSRALAQSDEIDPGLNARHPDFARIAVKIGRALGRESECLQALRAAEEDKSTFCIENSAVGAALMILLRTDGPFHGIAASLADKLKMVDDSLHWLKARNLSKQLTRLWPHLQTLVDADKRPGHGGGLVFTFRLKSDPTPPSPVTLVTTEGRFPETPHENSL